jgi:RNA polymerase sigma-70 factor (ECF subfamily)
VADSDDVLTRLARLARAERAPLAAIARGEGVTPEDAVDCVQEGLCTLLGMARRSALPEDADEWGALLAAIVRNVARNRRRRHFRALPHESFEEESGVAALVDDGMADEAFARAEEHVRLRACVNELCEVQKAVVTLRMLEEQAGEDVAAALGISAGYVAVLLLRAKRALRVCMAPEGAVGRRLDVHR